MDNNKGHLRRALCLRVKNEIVEDHQKRDIKEDLPSEDDLVTVSFFVRLKTDNQFKHWIFSAFITGSIIKNPRVLFDRN